MNDRNMKVLLITAVVCLKSMLSFAIVFSLLIAAEEIPAAVYAQESFHYTAGSVNGQNGGTGFSAAWVSSTGEQVADQGLIYPNTVNGAVGSGRLDISSATVSRAVNWTNISLAADATNYVSVLVNKGGTTGGNSGENLKLLIRASSDILGGFEIMSDERAALYYRGGSVESSETLELNTTYLMILKIVTRSSGSDDYSLVWYRQGDAVSADEAAVNWALTQSITNSYSGSAIQIEITAGSAVAASIDEIRTGREYSEVAAAAYSDLLAWDSSTVFLANADAGNLARVAGGWVWPETVSGKATEAPEIGADGVPVWHLTGSNALAYSAAMIPEQEGTLEMVVRPAAGQPPVVTAEHLFSWYQNEDHRFYFRFSGGSSGGLHSLWQSGGSAGNAYATMDRVAYQMVPGWTHFALQWKYTSSNSVTLQFWQDGVKLANRVISAGEFIAPGANDLLWVGSWTEGNIPLESSEIRSVRISEGWRFVDTPDTLQRQRRLLSGLAALRHQVSSLPLSETGDAETEIEQLEETAASAAADTTEYFSFQDSLCNLEQDMLVFQNAATAQSWLNQYSFAVENGLGIFYEDSLSKIPHSLSDYTPKFSDGQPVEVSLAVRERESFQLVLVNAADLSVTADAVSLTRIIPDGDLNPATIASTNIEISRIEFVQQYYADPLRPIGTAAEVLAPPGIVDAFWITVYAPEGTLPGLYEGAVVFQEPGGYAWTNSFFVNVRDFSLPVTPALKTAFGFSPEVVQKIYPELPSSNRDAWMEPYLRYMLRHRTSPKFYQKFGSNNEMLSSNRELFNPRLILKTDGTIECDFTAFDQQMAYYLPLGLNSVVAGGRYWDRQNSARGVIASGGDPMDILHRLWVYDEALGVERVLELALGSAAYETALKSVFSQWQSHLQNKGWLDMAFGYLLDEPNADMYSLVSFLYGYAKAGAPDLPLLITHAAEQAMTSVDIWCPMFHARPLSYYEQNTQTNTHWYYVCAQPLEPYGNFLIQQKAISHRMPFWHAWQYNGIGFLYWEINWWYNQPRDLRSFSSTMDGTLIYPSTNGPVGSIRYENIRDGIEDYDYLALLNAALDEDRVQPWDRAAAAALLSVPSELSVAPDSFTTNSAVLQDVRHEIAGILERCVPSGSAVESFMYPSGSVNGRDGGAGFAAPWVSSTAEQVAQGGLAYPLGVGLTACSNRLDVSGATVSRAVSWTNFSLAADATNYVSVLLSKGGSGSASDEFIRFKLRAPSDIVGGFEIDSSEKPNLYFRGGSVSGPDALDLNSTYLMLLKVVTRSSGSDDYYLAWFKQGDAVPLDDARVDWMLTRSITNSYSGSASQIEITVGTAISASIDEIRFGSSYADAVGTPYFLESFDYTPGTVDGRNGGVGFSGAWASATDEQVTLNGLAYSDGTVAAGNKLEISNAVVTRPVDWSGISLADDAVHYVSVLVSKDGSGVASGENVQFKLKAPSDIIGGLEIDSAEKPKLYYRGGSVAAAESLDLNTTYMMLLKIVTRSAGNDELHLTWYRQGDAVPSDELSISWKLSCSLNNSYTGSVNSIEFTVGSAITAAVDEIRIQNGCWKGL